MVRRLVRGSEVRIITDEAREIFRELAEAEYTRVATDSQIREFYSWVNELAAEGVRLGWPSDAWEVHDCLVWLPDFEAGRSPAEAIQEMELRGGEQISIRFAACALGLSLRAGRERKARLYLQHPEESPELIGVLPYLIHPPSKLSSTASWISFRDKTILPMMQHRPDDKNLPNFLKQVETILAWRASISPENRFWKAD